MNLKGKTYVIGGVLIATLFTVIGILYSLYVTDLLTTESQMHMSEVALQGATSVGKQIARDFDILSVLADGSISNPEVPMEQKMQRLTTQADKFDLFRMGLADLQGDAITSDGYEFSVADRAFFKAAVTGEKFVTEPIVDKVNQKATGIVYAVPVYYKNKITSVLFMGYEVEKLVKQIDISLYHESGLAFIINSNGDILLHPDQARQGNNIFEVAKHSNASESIEKFKTDLKNKESGVRHFYMRDEELFFAYAPIEVANDWFLVTSLQANVVFERSQKVIFFTVFFMTIITIVFSLAVLYIVLSKRKSNHQIVKLAFYDPLTGAANSERFQLDAKKLFHEFGAQDYTLLNFDIKQFRYFNKELGYQEGNAFLVHIVQCLAHTVQKNEIFARVGADQFLLLYKTKASEDETKEYIGTLRQAMIEWGQKPDRYYSVQMAFGLYPIRTDDVDIMGSIEKSNIARKSIKDSYQSDIAVYDKSMQSRIDRDKEIENSMPTALKNGEFKLFIQPKYNLVTEKIVGGEALVRWIRPDGTMMMPGEFIPLFEKTGAIYDMDMYMLECVCKFLQARIVQGLDTVPISINQSRCYMYNHTYIDTLCKILQKQDVPPALIEFEITENIVYTDLDKLVKVFDALHQKGFSISLDDFGSGYSSLNVLKDFKVDVLKLDRFMLSETLASAREKTIVANIIKMAKELKMAVVAEGVETLEQVKFLRESGCETAQGYYYSKPVSADEFDRMLYHA